MRTLFIRFFLLTLLWVKKRVINAFHAKMKAEARYASLGEWLRFLVRTYFQEGSVPLSSHGLKPACLREVLINNQEETPGGIISSKGIKKCLIEVPLINLIWLCQPPVTRSPCSGAGLLHDDGTMVVKAACPSTAWDTTETPASLPHRTPLGNLRLQHQHGLKPPQAPSPPTKNYFLKPNHLLTFWALAPDLPAKVFSGGWSSQGRVKDEPDQMSQSILLRRT